MNKQKCRHLLPFLLEANSAITQISRLRPAGSAGGQGKSLGACCQRHGTQLVPLLLPTTFPGAEREANLKSVNENPHCVPDPGSAGRHHDFGSFGGNCRRRKARSEKYTHVRGTGDRAGKGRAGKTEEKVPVRQSAALGSAHPEVGALRRLIHSFIRFYLHSFTHVP